MSTSARQRLLGVAASAALVAIVLGLPALLVAIGASPIPADLPTLAGIKGALLAPDDGTLLLGLFRVVAWLSWGAMAVSLAVEGTARFRHVEPVRMPGLGHPQSAARALIAAAALLFVATPALDLAVPAPAHGSPAGAAAVGQVQVRGDAVRPVAQDSELQPHGQERPSTSYTVRPGDSLWRIAEDHLGDGARYAEIVALNRDLVGAHPSFLRPGWVLTLPAQAAADGHSYTVEPGDTLSGIARKELGDASRYEEIFRASTGTIQPSGNRLTDPDVIDVGWQLTIPASRTEETPRRPHHSHDPGLPPQPQALPTPPEGQAPPASETGDPGGGDQPGVDVDDADDSVLEAPWILTGLTSGSALLAAGLLLGLRSRRRAALRNRRPGRAIAAPASEVAPVEMTVHAAGAGQVATIEYVHEALLRLAASVGEARQPMPPVAAAELSPGRITLHLTSPAELPAPWSGSLDHSHWHIDNNLETEVLGPETGAVEAPYPLLVTVGTSDAGETWMLNCEELGTLSVHGDAAYAHDFVRHVAAQLAVNPWSRRVRIDCIGIAEETVGMDERIAHYATADAASRAIHEVVAAAVADIDRATKHGTDVSTGRTGIVDDDAWPARMVLGAATASRSAAFDQLLRLVEEQPGRSATSVVLAGDLPDTFGAVLTLTASGRLQLAEVGLDLVAVGLTSDEARGCALLYAQADAAEDAPVPADPTDHAGWENYADRAGALRREHTVPRFAAPWSDKESLVSLLEGEDDDYVTHAAVVEEDLERLAPMVPAQVRSAVEDADPTLDQDIVDWFSPQCPRPRLGLLGPVLARTHGKALAKRRPYYTELLAFLALNRRRGVSVGEVARTFGITEDKARDYAQTLREWLGVNVRTGEKYLPNADMSPIARATGVNAYQVDADLLIDADLLRRLRLRADARGGHDGQLDLQTALGLVQGPPFSNLREAGWNWLFEGERHDEYAKVAIADIALTVATHALATGDLLKARSAAVLAMEVAPDEEATRLCLVRVTEAEGHGAEAERMLREDVCDRSDDGDAPMELSERTRTIIRNHAWLAS